MRTSNTMRKTFAALAFSLFLVIGMATMAFAQDNGSDNGSNGSGGTTSTSSTTETTAFSSGGVGNTSLARTGADNLALPLALGGGLVIMALGARRLGRARA